MSHTFKPWEPDVAGIEASRTVLVVLGWPPVRRHRHKSYSPGRLSCFHRRLNTLFSALHLTAVCRFVWVDEHPKD